MYKQDSDFQPVWTSRSIFRRSYLDLNLIRHVAEIADTKLALTFPRLFTAKLSVQVLA